MSENKNALFDERDLAVSATLKDFPALIKALDVMKKKTNKAQKMLDVGCGYGGLSRFVANYLGVPEIYGLDIDENRLSVARERGIKTHKIDINTTNFPFNDDYFDIVTSFGVIEHLLYYDPLISEAYRVLKTNGVFLLSMPNLGSYINRVALVLGYQPRDVEISKVRAFGVFPKYDNEAIQHIHSATLRAITEMLRFYGFSVYKTLPLNPKLKKSFILKLCDLTLGRFSSLSRRFMIISIKT